jgi:hypothetical protein
LKRFILLLPLLSLSCLATEESQNKTYSIGVGMGAMYSGIGVNLALVSENDLKYISAGCTAYGSMSGAECGLGIGWITTELFDFGNNNHGFGVYAGILGKENSYTYENNQYSNDENNFYGAGLSYTYFKSGINQSSLTLGLSIHATNADYDGNYGGFFQVGYQF